MNTNQIVEKLSQVRGAIPLPASMTRRGFVGAAGAVAASAALAGAALAQEAPAPDASAPADAPEAKTAASGEGMTFSGNEGKTMGQVLGAGWLGEEPEIPADQIAETLETYIVVCGAGHAGTACARKAAELGAQVVVVEAQPEDGFMVLGNDIGHINSKWQTELNGVPEYSPADFINQYRSAVRIVPSPRS